MTTRSSMPFAWHFSCIMIYFLKPVHILQVELVAHADRFVQGIGLKAYDHKPSGRNAWTYDISCPCSQESCMSWYQCLTFSSARLVAVMGTVSTAQTLKAGKSCS